MQTTYSSDSSLTPAHTYTSSPASSFEGSQSDRLDVEEVAAILRDAIVMQERSIRSLAGRVSATAFSGIALSDWEPTLGPL